LPTCFRSSSPKFVESDFTTPSISPHVVNVHLQHDLTNWEFP
jgi:hypothetical protein